MAGDGDQGLSNELAHLIKATTSPETITAEPEYQGAIRLSRTKCTASKTELDRAVKAVDDDQSENKAVALTFAAILTDCLDELRVMGGNIRNRLLNLRAEEERALGEVEMSNRSLFISTNIDLPPSKIAALGRTPSTNKIRSINDRLAEKPEYVRPEELAGFTTKVEAVEDAHQKVVDESLDDQPLFNDLVIARTEAISCRVAFRSLLDGILRFEHSSLNLDQLLLRTASSTLVSGTAERGALAPTPDEGSPESGS
jgi:hypothetical protein